jgi:heme-degrading monooxygenase HmoA
MIVMFSARRLKPGAWDQFRNAWEGDGEHPPGLKQVIHARNIRDEDEVISFGVFDMSEDDYRKWREQSDSQENSRVSALSAFVENDHVSGVYDVIETIDE